METIYHELVSFFIVHKYAASGGCEETFKEEIPQCSIIEMELDALNLLWDLRSNCSRPGRGAILLWALLNFAINSNTTLEVDRIVGVLGLVRSLNFEIEITYERLLEVIAWNLTVGFIFQSTVQFDCLCITAQGLKDKTKCVMAPNTRPPHLTWLRAYRVEGQYYADRQFPVTWSCSKLPPECKLSSDVRKVQTPAIIFD